ncbi:MAG TPA: prepilin peptidase [Gemmatimonadaceae bacterium]|nr:prepilin peptidase [Gemmatimonadaceae bacterium]
MIFTAVLLTAAFVDLRKRRIPNSIVAVLAILGLAFSMLQRPVAAGFGNGVAGLMVALACWLPFYALGWLGAGDVKLFAAAGAWIGPIRAVEGALVAALAGAALSLIWMIRLRGVKDVVVTLGMSAGSPELLAPSADKMSRRSSMPYGLAIAFGAICAGWLPRLFFSW